MLAALLTKDRVLNKLLILDLDETLIHASETPLDLGVEHDFETDYHFVYKRPHVDEFLEFCRQEFKVAVWTSAGSKFAQIVYENLFGLEYKLEFLWSRDRCTRYFRPEFFDSEYLKNLKKSKRRGFPLEKTIMVDNTPAKLAKNYGNLVKIEDFKGDQSDRELPYLIEYLKELKQVENVRSVEKRGWRKRYAK